MFAIILKCHFYCNKRDVARFGEMSVEEGGSGLGSGPVNTPGGVRTAVGVYTTPRFLAKGVGRGPPRRPRVRALGAMLQGDVYAVYMVCIHYVCHARRVEALDEHHRRKCGHAKFAFSARPSNSGKHVIGGSTDKTNWIFVILVVSRPQIHSQTAEKSTLCKKLRLEVFYPKIQIFW